MAKKNSVTDEFISERVDGNAVSTPKTGVWYSGFNRIKDYAISNGIPFVSVWSNGDACSYCTKLEANFMSDTFKEWMPDSKIIYWFGYSGDKEAEDRSTGKTWAKNKRLTKYPFMRFYWTDGESVVDYAASGNDWNKRSTDDAGAKNIIDKLEKLLADVEEKSAGDKTLKIRYNPEWTKDEIEEFKENIKSNGGYCPCQDKSKDTKCMCKSFREKKTSGICICELYEKYWS